jgi:hypothetical protein
MEASVSQLWESAKAGIFVGINVIFLLAAARYIMGNRMD